MFNKIFAMRICGFLFLFIIISSVASEAFGDKIISDLDSDAKLQNINDDPNKFKISIVLALMEHFSLRESNKDYIECILIRIIPLKSSLV